MLFRSWAVYDECSAHERPELERIADGYIERFTEFDIIKEINAQGKTILLVEQNAFAALNIAHYAYVLEVGQIVLQGPGEELIKNPQVREAYLGV